jgi:hypothetical protein
MQVAPSAGRQPLWATNHFAGSRRQFDFPQIPAITAPHRERHVVASRRPTKGFRHCSDRSHRAGDRLQAGMDKRIVGAGSHRLGTISRNHPPVDARTVECPGGCVSQHQQMLPVLMPDRKAGRCEIRTDPLRLSPAHWNHPDGATPRHRVGNALRTNPIRHLRSVWRKTGIEAVSGYQPCISAKRWHLVDAATIPVRPEHDPTSVRRKVGHPVAGTIERQTDRRASGNVSDVEIESSRQQTSIGYHAGIG